MNENAAMDGALAHQVCIMAMEAAVFGIRNVAEGAAMRTDDKIGIGVLVVLIILVWELCKFLFRHVAVRWVY